MKKKEVIFTELSEIKLRKKADRLIDDEITVLMSSGFSIQDVKTERLIYEKATKEKVGKHINLIG